MGGVSGWVGEWAAASLLALAGSAVVPPAPPPAGDPAFDAALPPLDAAAAPAEQAPLPPAATDPQLTAPLPPLATFDATPPAEVAVTPSERATKLSYRLELSGLKPIGLEDRFRELSALVDGGKKAANAQQIRARADQDVLLAERLLHSEGYYDGVVTASVDPVANTPDARLVTLTATPGPRYGLGKIVVTGAPPEPTALAIAALDLKTGQPIVAPAIEAAEANVSLQLPQAGYPFVALGDRDVLLDDATHTGDYTLPVDAGPKSRFGGIRTAGDAVFASDHIAILRRFKPGQLYDSRKVDDLRQAMVATSLFSTVGIEPVRTGEVNGDGTETVDLLVRQSKGPWRTLAASGGYGTGEGIKLTGSWTNRNLFPPEGALIVEGVAGTLQQSLGVTFRRSNAGKRDRSFQAAAAVSHQDFDAYSAKTVNLSASLSRVSTPLWQKRWTYSVGVEVLASDESKADVDTADRSKNTYFIAALPLQLGYDRSNSLLDATSGYRITGRLSPEASLQGGFYGYYRALIEASGYYPLSDSLTLAARTRLGSIMGASRDRIAPSRRLYAGGGGSVRGFGYQQLGPKDADNDPVGGRALNEFAIETRYRFGNFGIVPFFDAGQVYDATLPKFSALRYGAGIGGRYYTSFGPFRLDVATPIARKPGESKVAVYVSIGQAF